MSQAFLLDCIQKESSGPPPESARAVISALLEEHGLSAAKVQEVHWLSAERIETDALWAGLSASTPVFFWPGGELMDHFALQSAVRMVRQGERDLALVGQTEGEHSAALLLASTSAVGRYNLLPRGRVVDLFSLCGEMEGQLNGAALEMEKRRKASRRRSEAAQAAGEESSEDEPPAPEAVDWIASAEPADPGSLAAAFPRAKRLLALPPAPQGSLFLLAALLGALKHSRTALGLVLSATERQNGLATLIERL